MSINKTFKELPFIHHELIEEWDIKSANTSLMRYYNLTDPKIIGKIENMPKEKREVAVGKLSRKDKAFSNNLEKAFTSIMEEFISANKINIETDVIAFKKDSIFVRNRYIKKSSFDDTVHFIKKNTYTGCLLLPRYEFYYSDNKIDVKGVNDSKLHLHIDGMLSLVNSVMQESRNWIELNKFMKEYSEAYKNKLLPFNAYREFVTNSQFRVMLYGNEVMMDDIDEDLINYTDITFNYIHVYLEILKAICK